MFADFQTGAEVAGWVTLGTVIGTVISAVFAGLVKWRQAKTDTAIQETDNIIEQWQKVVRLQDQKMSKQDRRIEQHDSELNDIREELHQCHVEKAELKYMNVQMKERMDAYEDALAVAGIPFIHPKTGKPKLIMPKDGNGNRPDSGTGEHEPAGG